MASREAPDGPPARTEARAMSTPKASNPDDESIRLRRERKRATDRVAQREHRRRQKLYIEDLESQLAFIREGSTSQQVGELMRENKMLRDELERYRTFFNSVEDLVMDEWQDRNRSKTKEPQSDVQGADSQSADTQLETSPQSENMLLRTTSASVIVGARKPVSEQAVATSSEDIGMVPSANGTNSFVIGDDVSQTNGQPWNRRSPPGAFDWFSTTFTAESLPDAFHPGEVPRPISMHDTTILGNATSNASTVQSSDVRALQMPTGSTPEEQQFLPASRIAATYGSLIPSGDEDLDPSLLFASAMQKGPLLHQILPSILDPSTPQDQHVHFMIQRARLQSTRLSAPNLTDFLFENPNNVLSIDLKRYLEPVRKARRTAEFFATYWVLYLLLRWQINRDEESYYNVPLWLRPTELQIKIQHDIAADLLAWPLIRDELIMMSLQNSGSIHEVLKAIGLCLEVDIPMNDFSHGNGEKLHAAITDLKNWKLHSDFFVTYPALRPLYDRSFEPYV